MYKQKAYLLLKLVFSSKYYQIKIYCYILLFVLEILILILVSKYNYSMHLLFIVFSWYSKALTIRYYIVLEISKSSVYSKAHTSMQNPIKLKCI